MKRFRSWYGSLGLAVKQFLFLSAVTTVLFALLVWNNWKISGQLIEEQMLRDAQTIVERTNYLLNAYSDHIQSILLLLQMNRDVFVSGNEKEAEAAMRNYLELKGTIAKTLYFITESGKVYCSEQVLFDILGNPPLLSIYKDLRENYGAINWSEPYYSPLTGETVAFVRPVYSKENQLIGTAVVEIDLSLVHKRLEHLLVKPGQSYVVTTSRHLPVDFQTDSDLLIYENHPTRKRLDSSFLQTLLDIPAGVRDLEVGGRSAVVIKSGQNLLGWNIISLIDKEHLYSSINRLDDNFRSTAAIWFLALIVSAFMLSRSFTKPVRILAAKMDRVRDFDVLSPLPSTREDEIGSLIRSYNALMERVHTLIGQVRESERRKKEYELKMLQSQIGPHFLYNTLACIGSLAKQHKIDEVRQTIRSLIGLLSFSFHKSSEYATLAEELESLRMYAQIQQMRYGDLFRLEIRTDPELLDCEVLKLLLQPLIENAIFHGIAAAERRGTITVIGRSRGAKLQLFVIDDGAGISREALRSLALNRKQDPKSFNHVGLINVHERIRIHYGEEYGLRILSRPNRGTVVRVELPRRLLRKEGNISGNTA